MAGRRKKENGGATPERIEKRRYPRELLVELTELELAAKSNELAVVVRARDALLERKRSVMQRFKEQVTSMDNARTELAEAVETKKVRRPVECAEMLQARTSEILTVRLDTGEVLETRTASAEELQEKLPL